MRTRSRAVAVPVLLVALMGLGGTPALSQVGSLVVPAVNHFRSLRGADGARPVRPRETSAVQQVSASDASDVPGFLDLRRAEQSGTTRAATWTLSTFGTWRPAQLNSACARFDIYLPDSQRRVSLDRYPLGGLRARLVDSRDGAVLAYLVAKHRHPRTVTVVVPTRLLGSSGPHQAWVAQSTSTAGHDCRLLAAQDEVPDRGRLTGGGL